MATIGGGDAGGAGGGDHAAAQQGCGPVADSIGTEHGSGCDSSSVIDASQLICTLVGSAFVGGCVMAVYLHLSRRVLEHVHLGEHSKVARASLPYIPHSRSKSVAQAAREVFPCTSLTHGLKARGCGSRA